MRLLYLDKERVILNNQRKIYDNEGNIKYSLKSNALQTRLQLLDESNKPLYNIKKTRAIKRTYGLYDVNENLLIEIKRKHFFYETSRTNIVCRNINSDQFDVDIIGYQNYMIKMNSDKKLSISKKDKSHHRTIEIYDITIEKLLIAIMFTVILVKEEVDMSN